MTEVFIAPAQPRAAETSRNTRATCRAAARRSETVTPAAAGAPVRGESGRTVPAVNRAVMCALVALAPARAHADGIAIVGGSPRAIGRAGAATVGDDGGGALLINP